MTAADIADFLKAKGFEIDRRKLILPEPIKAIGEHDVPLKLHREVTVPLKVQVVKEGAVKERRGSEGREQRRLSNRPARLALACQVEDVAVERDALTLRLPQGGKRNAHDVGRRRSSAEDVGRSIHHRLARRSHHH